MVTHDCKLKANSKYPLDSLRGMPFKNKLTFIAFAPVTVPCYIWWRWF